MTFGTFIEPDLSLRDSEDPAAQLDIQVYSGYQARGAYDHFLRENSIFDNIAQRILSADLRYEDQCSARYYYDLVRVLRDFNGHFDRLVEVGVFMGGSSSIFAGCIEKFDFDLDMVDINPKYLQFAYERIRRTFPEATGRVRLFHGDIASYVRHVMLETQGVRHILHHDGAHKFNQVVKDMAALYYARDRIYAIIAQDTHLRGTIEKMNFVDMALYAVFGTDLKYAPIGESYAADTEMSRPNIYQGNYFVPGAAEGFVLPMAANRFVYPHPALRMDDFLPPARAETRQREYEAA
ncbi:class I SAM-dependent methyltransferase [Sphingomonas pokkalii]|uniref:Class I SAM-dependent methyltransferase n=1 Tax=Sphingomonas pokkalii TaxID=2175090 RepID=A0A2U0SE15_9SPHN|nr:class I SAM-dependent methyltransferase [Sphingomonas pokkalii]PVX29616.1 hypothetical protein DD559_10025 [Sphingomonas pokkalii]